MAAAGDGGVEVPAVEGLQRQYLIGLADLSFSGQPYSGNQRLDVLRMGEVVGLDDGRVLDVPRIESDAAAALRMN